jgi:hypothetical protein
MATIINTLEVTMEQPREPTAAGGTASAAAAPAVALAPRDIEDILDRQSRGAARRFAH